MSKEISGPVVDDALFPPSLVGQCFVCATLMVMPVPCPGERAYGGEAL